MPSFERSLHISLIAIPDAVISTLAGIYDVLAAVPMLTSLSDAIPSEAPFDIEIVGEEGTAVNLASGLPITTHKNIVDIGDTDIVIVPSVLLRDDGWQTGRYPTLVQWLRQMHAQGSILCSACSGVFLLAETGLFDGRETTVHWSYAQHLRRAFPEIRVAPERALLAVGTREELVSSGASSSWHDLVLYLIARYVNPAAAQAVAKFFALQWHRDGLAPYVIFDAPRDHGDALVLEAQDWLCEHLSVAAPVEEMVRRSHVPARSFKRRFSKATGYSPIAYVQLLRIEEAKRRLEGTDAPIDEISWAVGYEDPAFFRRLFKRVTRVTPGAYRRKFQLPDFNKPEPSASQSHDG